MTPRSTRPLCSRPRLFAAATGTLLLALGACRPAEPTTAPGTTPAPPTAEQSPFSELNLGFEDTADADAATVPGWDLSRSDYPVALDTEVAFEGSTSLRSSHDGLHRSGGATLELPIGKVRGQLVTASVQVRTDDIDRGGVGVRLLARRGDDELARDATSMFKQLKGDSDWTTMSASIVVPSDAESVRFVLDHGGTGHAWFDGVTIAAEAPPPPVPTPTLRGTVLTADGSPAAHAEVAGFSREGAQVLTTTNERGEFSVETPAGTYAVGVTAPSGVASHAEVKLADADAPPVALTLAAGSTALRGTVVDSRGAAFGNVLTIVATADDQIFPTRTADDGTWSLSVPQSERYMTIVEGTDGTHTFDVFEDPTTPLTTTVPRGSDAPPAAVAWIAEHHVPLATVDPTAALDDLPAIDRIIGKATVVGLGETTHGTREFFQMKHRTLRYLVERKGFRVFAIEANRTECRAIDHYIQTGEGDPKAALRGIYFWTWNTHEVLDLIEWMRDYNLAHPDDRVHFVGFDAQTPDVAARNVTDFITPLDVPAAQREAVARFGRPWNAEAFMELDAKDREQIEADLGALAQRFEQQRAAWSAATSSTAVAHAQQDLTVVRQVLRMRQAPGMTAFAARDRAMADNILAIEQQFGRGTKTVVWAHNGHVARAWKQSETMGQYLGQALGKRYVSVGFAFDRGGFQAIAIEGQRFTGLREHRVGPAKNSDIEAALRQAGSPLFALDLRTLPKKGEVAQWMRGPLPMRQIGAGFSDDDQTARAVEPVPDRFDVLLFVEQTTRARPIRD